MPTMTPQQDASPHGGMRRYANVFPATVSPARRHLVRLAAAAAVAVGLLAPGLAAPAGASPATATGLTSAAAAAKTADSFGCAATPGNGDSLAAKVGGQTKPSWAIEPPAGMVTLSPKHGHIQTYNSLKSSTKVKIAKGTVLPNPKSKLIQLDNPTPQGFKLTMPAFGQANGYYYVLLPVHPNQVFAWVKASDVKAVKNGYRLEISQKHHRLLMWRGDSVIGSFAVAVGRTCLPTPNGYFFANQILPQANPAGDYGPYIVSTSGFSEVLKSFEDGDAAVGLHGTNEPQAVGTNYSHGCIRMYDADIAVVARTIPVGTLFEIHP